MESFEISQKPKKRFIKADEFLRDSFELGLNIIESGFRPDLMLVLWRGGSPVGIAVHELFLASGIAVNHIPIKTALYVGIENANSKVTIQNLEDLKSKIGPETKVLIVDDVVDTGKSVESLISQIEGRPPSDSPAVIKIASVWNKPAMNLTGRHPDFFLRKTEDWLVFPHELEGLTASEVTEKGDFFEKLLVRIKLLD